MIGKTISHYKIIEHLGSGGMGVVYKAEDLKLKRTVALKFLPPEITRDPGSKKRFVHEAQAVSALQHENICVVHDVDETKDGQLFICMEYYKGQTLKKKIERRPLDLNYAINIAIQIAKGLKSAHNAKMIHRDLKPANIIITEHDVVKIVDFGLAKLAGQTKLTKIGSTVGTVAYMSPEQIRGSEIDLRSDIWSLGVVIYEMLSCRLPFEGEYDQAMIYSIINEAPPTITSLNKDVTPELEGIINKLLAKEPRDRYQTIDELLSDLENYPMQKDISFNKSLPDQMSFLWRKKSISRILILAITFVMVVVIFFLLRPPKVTEPISIVVIPFENNTGNAYYDTHCKSIASLLITNLEQSGRFRVTTRERLRDLIKQMGKKNLEFPDSELGFALCRMEGVSSLVVGSLVKMGDIFTTDLKILDVESKEIIKSAQSSGKGVESILEKQIDELTEGIVTKLSDISVKAYATSHRSISEVTTTSMEAYNYFSRGREEYENFYTDDARRFLEKAIELDSTFATAYLYLAWSYSTLGKISAKKAAFAKAILWSEKTTPKERLYIESAYAGDIERNPTKKYQLLKKLVQQYPQEKRVHLDLAYYYRDEDLYHEAIKEATLALKLDPNYGWALNCIAYCYADIGDYDKAKESFIRYAQISPGDANPFDSLGELYFKMGKLDEAISNYEEVVDIRPDFHDAYWRVAFIYALKENYSTTLKWIDQYITIAPTNGIKSRGYWWKSLYLYWLGSIDKSLEELRQAEDLALRAGNAYWKARADWMQAWLYLEKGDIRRGRKSYESRLDFLKDYYPENVSFHTLKYHFYYGISYLRQSHIDSAEQKLSNIKALLTKIHPNYMNWGDYFYNLLKAEILLSKGMMDKAIEILGKNFRLDVLSIASNQRVLYDALYLKDLLARTYVKNKQLNKAITEYEYLITFHPDDKKRCLIHPKFHFRLARLYEENGQLEKAIKQYEKFLDIWKNADSQELDFIDANKRLANLTNG